MEIECKKKGPLLYIKSTLYKVFMVSTRRNGSKKVEKAVEKGVEAEGEEDDDIVRIYSEAGVNR